MKYKKKPALIEATQWFRNGDHPQDRSVPIDGGLDRDSGKLTEGKVVGYFRAQHIPGGRFCSECGNVMQHHGMLTEEFAVNPEEIVHPGDYIVTSRKGKYFVQRPEQFEAMYDPYEPVATPTPDQLVT